MNQQKAKINGRLGATLPKILYEIEEQLAWGASDTWTGSDFEKLSDLLFEKTGQSLSVSTLKRLWGRTSQSVQPSVTTLNILAQFTGAESWRAFDTLEERGDEDLVIEKKGTRRIALVIGVMVLVAVLLFTLYGLKWDRMEKVEPKLDPTQVSFSLEKVTIGIPNTVIFRYNIGDQQVDSLELQQTWDSRKRILLNPGDSLITTTYMSPGYYNAKLVADNEIIKTLDLQIQSNGLTALVSTNKVGQVVLPQKHYQLDDSGFHLGPSFKEQYPEVEMNNLSVVNFLPEPIISADTFATRLQFKLSDKEMGDPCHAISLIIRGSEDVFMLNIGIKGCAGKFGLYLGGVEIAGEKSDLSSLGFEINQSADFQLRKEGPKVWASINAEEILLSEVVPSIGRIGGMSVFVQQEVDILKMEMSDQRQQINLLQ